MIGIGVVLIGIVAFCFLLWQPDRQIRRHHELLLEAVGDRRFGRVEEFLAEDYSDPWNESGKVALKRLREVLRQYFTLTLWEERIGLEVHDGTGTVSAHVRVDGRGTALAEVATKRVNELSEPFLFRWRKESWKPWDWKLVRVENPDLRLSHSADFW